MIHIITIQSFVARNSPIPPVASPIINTSPTPTVSQTPTTPNLPDSRSSQILETRRMKVCLPINIFRLWQSLISQNLSDYCSNSSSLSNIFSFQRIHQKKIR